MSFNEIFRILSLQQDSFFLLPETSSRLFFIILVVILASISEAIGQSVVLFINRVKRHRFLAALLTTAIIYFFNYFFWVMSISLIVKSVLKVQFDQQYAVFFIVALAYLPRLFGFLVFSPLLGSVINVLLKIWGMLILHLSLVNILGLANPEAVVIVLIGFLLTQIIKRSFGHPLIVWARALTRRVAGVDLELSPDSLSKNLDEKVHEIVKERLKK